MADYIINYTDTTKLPFTIRPYTTNGPAIPTNTALATNATSANTSLILLGQGMYQYGEIVAEDFVHLLENFAGPTAPVYPIQGQLWYKNTTNEMYIHDGTGFTQRILVSGGITSDLDMGGFKIINLADPTSAQDATTKNYTDTTFLKLNGTNSLNSGVNLTLSGGGEVLGLPAVPTVGGAATSKTYVDTLVAPLATDTLVVHKAGDTMTGTLIMSSNIDIQLSGGGEVLGLPAVPSATAAASKEYVDAQVVGGGVGTFVQIIGDTMTGPLHISGATLYSGVDQTVIGVNAGTNTITISGGDFTSLFGANVQFYATLAPTSGYQVVNYGGAAVGASPTGLANDATIYAATITVDGTPISVSITGSTAQTFTDLINELNADLGAFAIAAIVGGDIKITSITAGGLSTVSIVDTNLFNSTTGYVSILTAVSGVNGYTGVLTVLSSSYSAPNTLITTNENILVSSTSGTIQALPGLVTQLNAITELHGDLKLTNDGGPPRTVDFGSNLLQNVLDPVNDQDAATKKYVLDSITAFAPGADGTLSSATFTSNTLTLTSTVGSPITVSGILGVGDKIPTGDVSYSIYNNTATQSPIRRAMYNLTTGYPPVVNLTDVISTIDALLISNPTPLGRDLYTVPTPFTISAVSRALTSSLTIIAVVTGVSGTIEVSGGDYTTTFVPGTTFTVTGNTGLAIDTSFVVASSAFNIGPTTTTITVSGSIPIAATSDGSIIQSYGAVAVGGNVVNQLAGNGGLVVIAGNGGTGNGTYFLKSTAVGITADTFLYMSSSNPLPVGTTVSGTIAVQSMPLSNFFTVETNRIQVYRQGVKQYGNVRGVSNITFPATVLSFTPTDLVAGPYSFNIAVDGGGSQNIPITVSYMTDTITGVSAVNNTWSVSNAPNNTFLANAQIEVVDNVGLGVTTIYTIKSVITTLSATIITVFETIGGLADVSGTIRYPYTYGNLTDDIQASIDTVFPATTPISTPTFTMRNGSWYAYSPTTGATSSVTVADVNLIAALSGTINNSFSVGATYGYSEIGIPLQLGNGINFTTLPVTGEVYEIINIG